MGSLMVTARRARGRVAWLPQRNERELGAILLDAPQHIDTAIAGCGPAIPSAGALEVVRVLVGPRGVGHAVPDAGDQSRAGRGWRRCLPCGRRPCSGADWAGEAARAGP